MRVSVRGKVYPSQQSAAKDLGVTVGAIKSALHRLGHCDNVGLKKRYHQMGNTRASKGPIKIGPFEFSSKYRAAKEIGVSEDLIRSFANGSIGRRGMEKLVCAVMLYSDNRKRGA